MSVPPEYVFRAAAVDTGVAGDAAGEHVLISGRAVGSARHGRADRPAVNVLLAAIDGGAAIRASGADRLDAADVDHRTGGAAEVFVDQQAATVDGRADGLRKVIFGTAAERRGSRSAAVVLRTSGGDGRSARNGEIDLRSAVVDRGVIGFAGVALRAATVDDSVACCDTVELDAAINRGVFGEIIVELLAAAADRRRTGDGEVDLYAATENDGSDRQPVQVILNAAIDDGATCDCCGGGKVLVAARQHLGASVRSGQILDTAGRDRCAESRAARQDDQLAAGANGSRAGHAAR